MLTEEDIFVILGVLLGIALLGPVLNKCWTLYKQYRNKKGV